MALYFGLQKNQMTSCIWWLPRQLEIRAQMTYVTKATVVWRLLASVGGANHLINKQNSKLKIRVSVVRFRDWPPKFSAQLFSVGRFHLCFPQTTRGSHPFCVCQRRARPDPKGGQFDTILPSVLSKSPPTLSPRHAHIALCGKELCMRRRFGFDCWLGWPAQYGSCHRNRADHFGTWKTSTVTVNSRLVSPFA